MNCCRPSVAYCKSVKDRGATDTRSFTLSYVPFLQETPPGRPSHRKIREKEEKASSRMRSQEEGQQLQPKSDRTHLLCCKGLNLQEVWQDYRLRKMVETHLKERNRKGNYPLEERQESVLGPALNLEERWELLKATLQWLRNNRCHNATGRHTQST